jgi:hypothetical protein
MGIWKAGEFFFKKNILVLDYVHKSSGDWGMLNLISYFLCRYQGMMVELELAP